MTSRSIAAGSSEHPGSSSTCGLCEVPAVFLSHSGKQKPFVERLYEALLKVNHTAFFDQHSLPKGSRFPEHIKIAARECTLGVVVLSEEFLTSKWPMLELEILVQQRGPEAKVLPLFYKLVPEDLKSSKKLAKWQKKWEEMATPEDVIEWEKALRALRGFNGEIFEQLTSEARYIKRVVESICRQAPSPLPYDVSEIIGHHRLAEEVAGQFERLCGVRQDGGVRMVGLHGVGGGGKSTICRAMVNFYSSEYLGKSHHLELPTNGSDTGIIVQKCKEALEVLTDLDDKLLRKVHDIGQVIELMKAHLARYDVFLALDNVWESSREAAGRILKVGFSLKSKILVTSRSEEVLMEVFRDQNNSCVGPLPALEHEEAFQIFQKAFGLGDLSSPVRERHLVDRVLGRCKFHGTYHALALKALGMHVKNACTLGGWQHSDDNVVSSTLEGIRNADLTGVDDVIRLTYDNLGEHKKRVFLDIVLLPTMRGVYGQVTLERARQVLSLLYENHSPEATIKELSLGGLLQLATHGRTGEKMIRVHDLLSDLAEREAASSSRFLMAGRSSRTVEEIQWQELERVILDGSCRPQFIKQLQRQGCQRLQVLDAREVGFLERINMRCMPSLCVVKLRNVSLRSIQNWSAAALAIIDVANVTCIQPFARTPVIKHLNRSTMRVLSLKGVAQLQMLHLAGLQIMERIKGLDTLTALQSLRVIRCHFLKRIPDLSSLTHLGSLTLEKNRSLEEVGGFSATLRDVEISRCLALKRVPDMSGLTRLETLRISECKSLKRIPDLSGLARLHTLSLWENESMEKVGDFSSSLTLVNIGTCDTLKELPDISELTHLSIRACRALKRIPDLSCLARLDALLLQENESMEEVGGLSRTLRRIEISWCQALERLPDVSGLTCLEVLRIGRCRVLKRIPDLSGLACLDMLSLWWNESMEEVGGFSSSLRHVDISTCDTLKELPDISGLISLETLSIDRCRALKRIPDLSSLTRLDTLCLKEDESMEEVGCLSPTLRDVEISLCQALERVPDVSGLTRLEVLRIDCCGALKRIPDLSSLTRLERLFLLWNKSMEEVGGLSSALRHVEIDSCKALKKVPDISGLTRLEKLVLCCNEALEEVEGRCVSGALTRLCVEDCRRLRSFPKEFETLRAFEHR